MKDSGRPSCATVVSEPGAMICGEWLAQASKAREGQAGAYDYLLVLEGRHFGPMGGVAVTAFPE